MAKTGDEHTSRTKSTNPNLKPAWRARARKWSIRHTKWTAWPGIKFLALALQAGFNSDWYSSSGWCVRRFALAMTCSCSDRLAALDVCCNAAIWRPFRHRIKSAKNSKHSDCQHDQCTCRNLCDSGICDA